MDTGLHTSGALRSEVAYAELKQRLLIGDFPLNVRLGEERLAGIIGMSRTPVREALQRLHAEGLVKRGADGGFEPIAPDVRVMRQLYEVRVGLELQALQRPGRSHEPHDATALATLRDEWVAMRHERPVEPSPSFVLLDESFHVGLVEAAGNPALAEMLQQVNERIRVVRMQDFLTVERIEQTIEEHLAVVEAVLDGDLVQAELVFTEHVERSIEVVAERVERAIARMITGGQP